MMKNIKTFELFEGLFVGAKVSVRSLKELMNLAKNKKVDDFILMFAEQYGSACEVWMGREQQNKLMTMYASGKYDFCCLSGESEDGADDSKTESYLDKGWKVFADEQNFDSYDCVMYRKKK